MGNRSLVLCSWEENVISCCPQSHSPVVVPWQPTGCQLFLVACLKSWLPLHAGQSQQLLGAHAWRPRVHTSGAILDRCHPGLVPSIVVSGQHEAPAASCSPFSGPLPIPRWPCSIQASVTRYHTIAYRWQKFIHHSGRENTIKTLAAAASLRTHVLILK